jgi:hypothetical protein
VSKRVYGGGRLRVRVCAAAAEFGGRLLLALYAPCVGGVAYLLNGTSAVGALRGCWTAYSQGAGAVRLVDATIALLSRRVRIYAEAVEAGRYRATPIARAW